MPAKFRKGRAAPHDPSPSAGLPANALSAAFGAALGGKGRAPHLPLPSAATAKNAPGRIDKAPKPAVFGAKPQGPRRGHK